MKKAKPASVATSKVKKVKQVKALSNVSVLLTVAGRKYTANGETALEAVQNLQPEVFRGVGILFYENQGIKREKILGRPLMNRLFGKVGRLQKEIATKQISLLIS